MAKTGPIQLGDKCRDTVTGFTGIATARHEYLSGCVHWSLTPGIGKDGKPGEIHSFDEVYIEVIKPAVVKAKQQDLAPAARISGPSPVPSGRW